MIVFHYTGMQSEVESLKKLCSFDSKVSCHYFINGLGNIAKIVPEKFSAWHAGKSSWKNFKLLNKFSIGIELVNPGHDFGYRNYSRKQIKFQGAVVMNLEAERFTSQEKKITKY